MIMAMVGGTAWCIARVEQVLLLVLLNGCVPHWLVKNVAACDIMRVVAGAMGAAPVSSTLAWQTIIAARVV
jgi:hypothetical protein